MGRPVRKRVAPARVRDMEQAEQVSNQRRGETSGIRTLRQREVEHVQTGIRREIVKSKPQGKRVGLFYSLLKRTEEKMTRELSQLRRDLQTVLVPPRESSVPSTIPLDKTTESTEVSEDIDLTNKLSQDEEKTIIYNIKNINIEKPKFGKVTMHPMTFLEDLEVYLKKTTKAGQELDTIQECLEGAARDWARVYKERWVTYEDFKKDFLQSYWGNFEENELRRNIVHGVWSKQQEPFMLVYFLKIVGRAKMLSHTIPEAQLVTDVIRHYPRYIQ